MLIGDLPQDVTPSVDGTVPYSEDGIHLNFIKIQDLLGLGGGGDGGGGGNLIEIEFPDGTKGYYAPTEPDFVKTEDHPDGEINKAYSFICEKIRRHPERYFSAYITYGSAERFKQGITELDVVSYINSSDDNYTESYTMGYDITNENYNSIISNNFPYILVSSKQTVVQSNGRPYSKKCPILHMVFNNIIANRIIETYRWDPSYSGYKIGDLFVPPFEILEGQPVHQYYISSSGHFGINDGTGEQTLFNLIRFRVEENIPIPVIERKLIPIQHIRTPSPIYNDETEAFMSSSWDEDIYETNRDIQVHLKLWDVWHNSVFGYFCYHIITEDEREFCLYFDDQGETGELINGNFLNSTIWSSSGVSVTKVNGREINKSSTPWYENELDGDKGYIDLSGNSEIDPLLVRYFPSKERAMEWVNAVVLGLDILTPPASYMYTSNGGYAACVPLKRNTIYNWFGTDPEDPNYPGDSLYSSNDVIKESFIGFAEKYTNMESTPIAAETYLHAISFGNFTSVGFGIDDHESVSHIDESGFVIWADMHYLGRGGGGGSDLPVVDQSDEGKVLTVDSNGIWNDLYPEPFKLAGNIDSQTAIDVENYLSVRGGIRGDKVGGVASIYADPSVMHIGDYVDISSAKTGGFSASKSEDANTGVTTITLDINDIDKFMQIEAAAGSGINVTKSLDSQTHVRTYTFSNSSEISLPNYFNDFDSTMLSSWLSAFPIASDGAYHAINPGDSITMTKFSAGNTNETHQIDISVEFDVDANTPAGSYATVVLSTTQHSGTPIAVGTSISRVVGSAVDTRILIPGVKNTFKLSLAVVFTTDTRVYINVLQNSGSSIVGANNPYCSYKATRIGMSS